MKQSIKNAIEDELPDANYPDFEPGDKIRVVTEQEIGGQKRERRFEGICIARQGGGPDETFKVRKESFGVGVERIYPIHSPIIQDIEIIRKGKVNQAKLTYLEGRSTKESRIEEERVDLDEVNRVETEQSEDSETEETETSEEAQETDDVTETSSEEDEESSEEDTEPTNQSEEDETTPQDEDESAPEEEAEESDETEETDQVESKDKETEKQESVEAS